MRRIRPYLVGVVVGALLTLGGSALADVPDAQPSVPDPSHTFFVCVGPSPNGSSMRQLYALDKDVGSGTCPASPSWHEERLVPALPS